MREFEWPHQDSVENRALRCLRQTIRDERETERRACLYMVMFMENLVLLTYPLNHEVEWSFARQTVDL